MFGQPSTSGFGAAKPAFGFNSTQSAPLFGQPATSNTGGGTGFGTFGGTTSSAFGQSQTNATGTAVAKYQPHPGTDTLVKNGQTSNVNTRQHCITAMKEYESKSLEELRLEDYLANRKGPQGGGAQSSSALFGTNAPSTGLFGAPSSQPQSTGLFGQPPTNTLGSFGTAPGTFGQQQTSAFGQSQPTSLFAKPANTFGQPTSSFGQPTNTSTNLFAKPFGVPATSASTGFGGFGNTNTNSSPFGAKPFNQPPSTGLFGQTAPASTGNTFGQTSGFGGFGQNVATTQAVPLFGNNNTTSGNFFGGLSSSAPNTGFGGFGTATNTAAGGSLFGQKPAGFTGYAATPAFGPTTSSAASGFTLGTFSNPATSSGFGTFGQNNSFNKPNVISCAGFAPQSTAPNMGGGMGLGSNLMGMYVFIMYI